MLKTWDDVKSALGPYPLLAQREKSLSFAWSHGDSPTATFHVLWEELGGRPRIVLFLNLLPEVQTQTGAALRLNSEILIGGLISFRGYIALRQIMTLGGFDAAELHEVLYAMAQSSQPIVHRITSSSTQATPSFACGYAD